MTTELKYLPIPISPELRQIMKLAINRIFDRRIETGAQGAIPGPQVENIARVMHNAMHVDAGAEYADWDKDASESTRELFIAAAIAVISFLATPEPHSPHVHNFDANGICVTMGCTPAIPAAASTDERLAEIAERLAKVTAQLPLKEDPQEAGEFECPMCGDGTIESDYVKNFDTTKASGIQIFGVGADMTALEDYVKHSFSDMADLLRLVAELCQKLQDSPPHRRNVEETAEGIRICDGNHHRSADCEWTEYVLRERAESYRKTK